VILDPQLTFLCLSQQFELRLQGRDNLVHNLFDYIKSFDYKLQVSEPQLRKCDLAHCPSLLECTATDNVKYAEAVADLRTEFSDRLTDFKSKSQ
jgi:hypothetical protein